MKSYSKYFQYGKKASNFEHEIKYKEVYNWAILALRFLSATKNR